MPRIVGCIRVGRRIVCGNVGAKVGYGWEGKMGMGMGTGMEKVDIPCSMIDVNI